MKIDFSNPLQGRRWLKIIDCKDNYKLLFKANLSLPKNHLGFSFKTNKYGFRGAEDNHSADHLILGTSFAMGMSVNDGENWYENFKDTQFFNLAMSGGIISQHDYYKELYSGKCNGLLYLYHPNVWQFTKDQQSAIDKNINLFEMKGWKTDILSCLKLLPKYYAKTISLFKIVSFKKIKYRINPNYCFFKINEANKKYANIHLEQLATIAKDFENVYIVRVPVKEQLGFKNDHPLVVNYEYWWDYFKKNKSEKYKVIDLIDSFDLSHYHPYDTHWNAEGNLHFFNLVKKHANLS